MSLRLLSITRRYGTEHALREVSLRVQPGACTGLIGHNGAGKTTAMRVALGLERPDAGEVRIDGLDARRDPREARARLGGLIEVPGFHGHLDAQTNLVLLAHLQGLGRRDALREAARRLDEVGLATVGTKRVQAFSQGMRQRLGIAQALLGRPRYVLLDEPTNGLDPEGSAEVRALLERLVRDEGLGLLISSHQLHELAALCQHIAILRQGRLVVEATTDALLREPAEGFEVATDDDPRAARVLAELGLESRPAPAGGLTLALGAHTSGTLARHLLEAGLELRRLGTRPPSLEEIYLRHSSGGTPHSSGGTPPPLAEAPPAEPEEPGQRRVPGGSAVLRVLRYELRRLFSRWRAPALLALPALAAGLSIGLEKARLEGNLARVARGELASTTAVTGFGATALGLGTGLPLLALVLVALASQMIAGEHARGTLRNVLLRPQTRLELAAGKALAGVLLALGGQLLLGAVATGASAAAFGFGDLVEILPNGKPFPLVPAAELWPELVRVLTLPLAALLGALMLGFASGALVRGAAGALGLALGAVLVLDLARAALRGLGAEGWLLPAYLPTPLGDTSFRQAFADHAGGISNARFELDGSFLGLPQDLSCPLAWALVAFGLGTLLLVRRPVP